MFLCETKLTTKQPEVLGIILNYNSLFSVCRRRLSGGLPLLWNTDTNIKILSYSNHHIDVAINSGEEGWRFTGLYGHPKASAKVHTWMLIRRLANLFPAPWLCGGDFNQILSPHEKHKGSEKSSEAMWEFQKVLKECDLVDLGFFRRPYMWSNKRGVNELVQERLDRFLASSLGTGKFQSVLVTHLETWSSDHSPIFIEFWKRKISLQSQWKK